LYVRLKNGQRHYMARPDTAKTIAQAALWTGEIAPTTKEIIKLSILDWLCVGHAGRREPVGDVVRSMLGGEGGDQQASVFGQTNHLPMRAAAMANGTISHALDYDDTHFAHIGHTSVGVLPAVFAVGQATNSSFDAMLEAAVIGSELAIRTGVWLGRDHYLAGWHQTATAGAFGAAAASGRLLKVTPDQMTHAMALLGTRSSGLRAQFGTMGKPWNAGIAASNGVEVALLARAGMMSDVSGLDGPQGFGITHGQTSWCDGFETFGSDWMFDAVQHKFHACCHGIHASLEALSILAPNRVARVDVHINPRWMSVCNKANPTTGLEAKFSYTQVIAMALAGYNTGALDVYTDALCHDADLMALREKIHVHGDGDVADSGAIVSVDGREARFDLADMVPLSQRREKLLRKAAGLVGQGVMAALQGALETHDLPVLTGFIAQD
jgi:2-methylcitrate dehydratase PrpD